METTPRLVTNKFSNALDDLSTTNEFFGNVESTSVDVGSATPDTNYNVTDQTEMDSYVKDHRYQNKQLGLISKTVQETFKAVVWFGLIPVFTLLGIVGNVFGLYFLRYQRLQQSFYIFLFGLMAVDLLYLIIVLLTNSIPIAEQYNQRVADFIKCYSLRNLQLAQSFTYSTCSHIIMIMSAERLISIMFPLKFKSFSYGKYAVALILFLFVLNIVLLIPGFMSLRPKTSRVPETNMTTCIAVPTQWFKENVAFNQDYAAVTLTLARFIPGVATLFANIMIAVFMARHRFSRASLIAQQTRQARRQDDFGQLKTTVNLMVLSIALLVSLFPSALATICIKYFPNTYGRGGAQHYTYLFLVDLSYLLRVMSAANDFFIYVFTSKTSQKSFKTMLNVKCGFCFKQNNNDAAMAQSKATSDETLD